MLRPRSLDSVFNASQSSTAFPEIAGSLRLIRFVRRRASTRLAQRLRVCPLVPFFIPYRTQQLTTRDRWACAPLTFVRLVFRASAAGTRQPRKPALLVPNSARVPMWRSLRGLSWTDTCCPPHIPRFGSVVHAWTSPSAAGRVKPDKLALRLPWSAVGVNPIKVITRLVPRRSWLHHLFTGWTCPERRVVSRETSQSAAG